MSCNGCRVLRKGCSDTCVLRPCLQWMEGPDAQAHATIFVAKFFGRAGLISSLSAAPDHHRPALFRSLLFEACGRTIHPVSGAVGLLWTGNWDLCHAAVETVLHGGALHPLPTLAGDGQMADLCRGPKAAGCCSPSFSSVAKRIRKASADVEERSLECDLDLCLMPAPPRAGGEAERRRRQRPASPSMDTEGSVMTSAGERKGPTLLRLFV